MLVERYGMCFLVLIAPLVRIGYYNNKMDEALGRQRYKKIVRNSVNIIAVLSVISVLIIKFVLHQPFSISPLFIATLVALGIYNNFIHKYVYDIHLVIGPYVDAFIYSLSITAIIFESGGFRSPAFFLYYMIIFSTRSFLGPNIPLVIASFQTILITIFGFLYLDRDFSLLYYDIFVGFASMFMIAIYSRTLSVEFLAEYQARKAFEELDRRKTEFMALASHYIRTPITIMKGYLSELSRPELTDEQKDTFISRMRESMFNLNAIADDFLDVVTLEKGIVPLHVEEDDLVSVITKIYDRYYPIAAEKGLEMSLHVPSYPVVFLFDREKIVDIYENLISNAVKFTKTGAVTITVRTKGNTVECVVTDTGIGLRQNEKEELFKKLHRVQKPLAFDYEGKGIGLYIAKLIIEAHGGTISVSSHPNSGSTFVVTLPMIKSTA